MKKILLAVFIVALLVRFAIPEKPAQAQTGGAWVPYWAGFFSECVNNGECDLKPELPKMCTNGATPTALMIGMYGTININGSYLNEDPSQWAFLYNPGNGGLWTPFWNWYNATNEGILTYYAAQWYEVWFNTLALVDNKMDNDTWPVQFSNDIRGTYIYEIYAYCPGATSTPLKYKDRFSVLTSVISGSTISSPGVMLMSSAIKDTCAREGDTVRPVGSLSKIKAPNSQPGGAWIAGGGLDINYVSVWARGSPWSGNYESFLQALYEKEHTPVSINYPRASGYNRPGWAFGTKETIIVETQYAFCFETIETIITTCYSPLTDGSFEAVEVAPMTYSGWRQRYSANRSGWGRINYLMPSPSNPINFANFVAYGAARCGNSIQVIGYADPGPINILAKRGNFSDIETKFPGWGGRVFYRFSLKAYNKPVKVRVAMQETFGARTETVVFNAWVGTEWEDFSGSYPTPTVGVYSISFQLGAESNDGASAFAVDDVYVGEGSKCKTSCHTDVGDPPTPTPTITPTGPTPTITKTPTGPTPTGTATRTPTLYPTSAKAQTNLIENCSFGMGADGWLWSGYNIEEWPYWVETSYVVFTSNNYGYVEVSAARPGIAQQFDWAGGVAYVQFDTLPFTNMGWDVSIKNTRTGIENILSREMPAYSVYTHRYTINLSPGTYMIQLSSYGAGGSGYDDVIVSAGGYGSCVNVEIGTPTVEVPNWTATAPSYPTRVTYTPTSLPTSTQKPTSTSAPGAATSTPRPTFTPYPTWFPSPTLPPTFTKTPVLPPAYATWTAQPTYTPYPTYTPQPTHTQDPTSTTPPEMPTSTPRPTYTPPPPPPTATPTTTPPVPPPPPGYWVSCNRPYNSTDIAWWLEYEKCQLISFWAMSPRAVSTAVALPTLFAKAEPFGSMNELAETNKRLEEMVNSYDMQSGHLPGVDDAPDPSIFTDGPGAGSPWTDGPLIANRGRHTSDQCSARLVTVVGPNLSKGMCLIFNFLAENKITPWLQLFIDLGALLLLGVYFWRKWIDAGAN